MALTPTETEEATELIEQATELIDRQRELLTKQDRDIDRYREERNRYRTTLEELHAALQRKLEEEHPRGSALFLLALGTKIQETLDD